MVRGHIATGALNGLDSDDLSYPLAPPVEATRLGLYALVRLGSYDALYQAPSMRTASWRRPGGLLHMRCSGSAIRGPRPS
jgi:hypothetical protein